MLKTLYNWAGGPPKFPTLVNPFQLSFKRFIHHSLSPSEYTIALFIYF